MKWRLITCLILAVCMVLPVATAASGDDTDVTGTVPLVTRDISASNIGYHGATISWKTNGDATSQVFYDTVSHDNTADYAYSTEDTDLLTEHSIRLTGLSSGTTYHYRVRSAAVIDDSDFIAISEDYTFRTSSPAPPPPPTPTIETNLFGVEKSYRISRTGEILKTIEATSEDGMLTLAIPEGTIALDKDGKRLKSLQAIVDETPPEPPEDAHIIGLAYDFGPDGATFDPPMTLEYTYDPGALPEGVAEENLVLAYYDKEAGEWVDLECVIDTENNTITASVPHFTTFAIIGAVTPVEEEIVPPPPPPPAPAAFSLTGLSVTPVEVLTGEAVTITVPVANTGGTEGSYTVVLKINGVKEAEKSVTIAAGSSEMVTFSVTREEIGSYTVTVDGLSASFAVVVVEEVEEVPAVPAKPPVNWPLIGGVIGAIVIVGLVVFFQLRRRGKQQK